MKTTKIYWKKAIDFIKSGKDINQEDIDFNQEQIPVHLVGFFNAHNVRVPENLVFYDDDIINTDDIPEISDEDIKSGKIQWIKIHEFPIDSEIREWIVCQNIKLNELLPYLLKNFYQTVKFAYKMQQAD